MSLKNHIKVTILKTEFARYGVSKYNSWINIGYGGHTYNPDIWEADAGKLTQVLSQPDLQCASQNQLEV